MRNYFRAIHSLVQFGTDPDHIPLGKHVLLSFPHRINGLLHVYITVEPKIVLVRIALPLSGTGGLPQSTANSIINPKTKNPKPGQLATYVDILVLLLTTFH